MQTGGRRNKLVYVRVDEEGVFFGGVWKARDFREIEGDDELDRVADMFLREELENE